MDEAYPTDPDAEVESTETPTTDSPETEGEETTLVPKSFFAGADKKPGDRCEVEVVRSFEDEVQIRYVKHDESPEDEEPSDHMDAMDEAFGPPSDVNPAES